MRSERSVRPRRTLIERAKAGDEAYQSLVAEGHLDHYRREVAFVRSHASEWRRSAEEPRVPVSRLRSSTSSICVRRIWASRALVRWMVVRINRRAHRLPGGHQLGQFVGPKAFEACPLAEVWRPGYLGLHTDLISRAGISVPAGSACRASVARLRDCWLRPSPDAVSCVTTLGRGRAQCRRPSPGIRRR